MVLKHPSPDLIKAFILQSAAHQGVGLPVLAKRTHELEGVEVFASGDFGTLGVGVGFIDHDQICEFKNAPLDALQLISGPGEHQHQEKIHHIGHGHFGLSHAHRLDEEGVKAGGFTAEDGLARFAVHPPEGARGGRGANKRVGVSAEFIHSGFVPQNAAAADAAAGIYRQHRHLFARLREVAAQGLNEGALARSGHPGDAHSMCATAVGQQAVKQLLSFVLVVAAVALQKGDSPSQNGTVSGQNPLHIMLQGEGATPGGGFGLGFSHGRGLGPTG